MKLLTVLLGSVPLTNALSISTKLDSDKLKKALIVLNMGFPSNNYNRPVQPLRKQQVPKKKMSRWEIIEAIEERNEQILESKMKFLAWEKMMPVETVRNDLRALRDTWTGLGLEKCGYPNIMDYNCREIGCCPTPMQCAPGGTCCYKQKVEGECPAALTANWWLENEDVPDYMKDDINLNTLFGGRAEIVRQAYDRDYTKTFMAIKKKLKAISAQMGEPDFVGFVQKQYGVSMEQMIEEVSKIADDWDALNLNECGWGRMNERSCSTMGCCWSSKMNKCYGQNFRFGCSEMLDYEHFVNNVAPEWLGNTMKTYKKFMMEQKN